MLPKVLKKNGLIESEFIVYSNKSLRNKIIQQGLKKSLVNDQLLNIIERNLKGGIQNRLMGYSMLMAHSEHSHRDEVGKLIKRIAVYENPSIKLDVLRLANNEYAEMFQVVPFENQYKKIDSYFAGIFKDGNYDTKFEVKNGNVKLVVSTDRLCAKTIKKSCANRVFTFEHPGLNLSPHHPKIVELWGRPVGYLGDVSSFKRSIESKVIVVPEVFEESGKYYLMPVICQDFINKKGHDLKGIHILNSTDELNPLGYCASLTQLQKALMENVFFRPEENKKSPDYYFEIISNAFSGKQVFAFGISNVRELTESADQAKLKAFLTAINSQYYNFSKLAKAWFERSKLTAKTIPEVIALVKSGHSVTFTFRPSLKVRAEHMILIHDIVEHEDHYELVVYDSNLGVVPKGYKIKYLLDKKSLHLQSNYYPNMESQIPFI